MKKPEYYSKAIAPEQLTGKRFSELSVDTPVYLHPESEYDDVDVYVLSDRQVRVRNSAEIPTSASKPKSVLGRIGLMRVMIEKEPGVPQSGVIADFQYIKEPLVEYPAEAPNDQEDMNDWLEEQKDALSVDAFIVKEEDGVAYYGPEEFHPGLDFLRRNGRAIQKEYQREQRKKELAEQKANKSAKKSKQQTKK